MYVCVIKDYESDEKVKFQVDKFFVEYGTPDPENPDRALLGDLERILDMEKEGRNRFYKLISSIDRLEDVGKDPAYQNARAFQIVDHWYIYKETNDMHPALVKYAQSVATFNNFLHELYQR